MKRVWFAVLCLLLITPLVGAQNKPWEEIETGLIDDDEFVAADPITAIAPDGTLYAAWPNQRTWIDENSTAHISYGIHVKRFNGIAWEDVVPGAARDGSISQDLRENITFGEYVRLAIAPDGTPYIAWTHVYTSGIIYYPLYIRRFNGTVWEEVGTGSASDTGVGEGAYPVLDIAPSGTVYMAWTARGTGSSETDGIYVKRFNGIQWEETNPGSASCCGGGISRGRGVEPVIDIDLNNVPYIAWTCRFYGGSDQVCVRRFNGTEWEEVGTGSATFPTGMSNTLYSSWTPSLVIGPGAVPYITWQEWASTNVDGTRRQNWEIYVRRFNGTEWEEVGLGSASNGGISTTTYTGSTRPTIAFAGDGVPYVSWTEDVRGHSDICYCSLIFVRRFNGTEWEETHPGSATVIGIDDNSNVDDEVGAELVADGGNIYVTWTDESDTSISQLAAADSHFNIRTFEYSAPNTAPRLNFHTVPNLTLTWNPITWATAYEIQLDKSISFTSPEIPYTELSGDILTYQTPNLDSATYYWRIRARKPDNTWGNWSKPERFVILLP